MPISTPPLSHRNADVAFSADDLVYRYGERTALESLTFSVPAGATFGLLGPNGSGKTTLFRIISTLLRPDEGTARVLGRDCASQPNEVRRLLGVIFQQPALDAELSITENLRVHAALVGIARDEADGRIHAILDQFDLVSRAHERVKTLSGGLARRADLARGFLHRPKLLLLDEPTTGLDPVARRDLWDALDRLQRLEGTTLLVATHLMDEAERCDEVVILDRGRAVAQGSPVSLRAALGTEALWLESEAPEALTNLLVDRLGLSARTFGRRVLIEHEDPAAVLGRIYDAAGDHIVSATVRRPTLEDVFVTRTGQAAAFSFADS
ncbi:MAG: ABC transporter ATP-binding protein [Bacteroidota bacterium]